MYEKVDPKLYGLPSRTVLMKKGSEEFILVINRKSRIIMKDAKAIFNKVDTIRGKVPDVVVELHTTAPVCSKSIRFLDDKGIVVSIIE